MDAGALRYDQAGKLPFGLLLQSEEVKELTDASAWAKAMSHTQVESQIIHQVSPELMLAQKGAGKK